MKRIGIVLALYLVTAAAPAADLLAVYQRALQNDPQLREAEATRLAVLEAKPQALSALLPHLSGNGQISRERDTGSINQTQVLALPPCGPAIPAGAPCAAAGTPTTVTELFPFSGKIDTTIHRYTVDLKQSLFRWENWQALKRADSQVAQAEADYQAAQQDLMERVSQRYFDVLGARSGRGPVSNRTHRRHRRGGSARLPRQHRGGRHRRQACPRLHAGAVAGNHRRPV